MEGACVVLDLGSGFAKAEFAGTEVPRMFHNTLGTVKHRLLIPDQQIDGLIGGTTFVGDDVEKHRGILRLSHPVEHGHVVDWPGESLVIKHIENSLGVPTKDHPILVTEAPFTSRLQRDKLAQLFFEELQHPALLFAVQSVLSLYSSGHTTGIVLDVGDTVTHACPVVEGYSIREAARRVDFGGRDMTAYLQMLLRQHGHFLETSAEFDIVREIKESLCTVSRTARKENEKAPAQISQKYKLPDNVEISIGSELQLAPEVLFTPVLQGSECPGVAQVLNESIRKTDIDVRKKLYESVFLAGGTTLLNGFCQRFLAELTKQTPRDCRIKLFAPAERLYTTWIGGSFLAQLSSFKQMVTTREKYSEEGERILHAKVFW